MFTVTANIEAIRTLSLIESQELSNRIIQAISNEIALFNKELAAWDNFLLFCNTPCIEWKPLEDNS